MPEYLAPAVYVEEVDTGNKPIEGVSTSTAGMIGVTERGPVNVPILITSYGEYRRWFGERLKRVDFGDHCYLPHAVEGFFVNGGKRVFVTRVLDTGAATAATRNLFVPDTASTWTGQLVHASRVSDVTIAIADITGMPGAGSVLQIGNAASVEYRTTVGAPAAGNTVAVRVPLARAHGAGDVLQLLNGAAVGAPTALAAAVSAGDTAITVQNAAGIAANDVLQIGGAGDEEFAIVAAPPAGTTLMLRGPLVLTHANATVVQRINSATGASGNVHATRLAGPGDTVIFGAVALAGLNPGLVMGLSVPTGGNFNPAAANAEVRRIGALSRLDLAQAVTRNLPVGTVVERITLGAPAAAVALTAESPAGATVITVSDRAGMAAGHVLTIGAGADLEYAQIAALPAQDTPPPTPDPGRVALRAPLTRQHSAAAGTVAVSQVTAITLRTVTGLSAARGATAVVIADGNAVVAADFVRLASNGTVHVHALTQNATALTPQVITLTNALNVPHELAEALVPVAQAIEVRALDAGRWGNRLRVGAERQDPPLLRTTVRALPLGGLRLESAVGVETGTELSIIDSNGVEVRAKVQAIDRNNDFLISFATPLPVSVAIGNPVVSVEYRFVVDQLRQPDPAIPARDNQAIDREVFPSLSLDPRHSRYFQSLIGCTWNMADPTTTLDDTAPVGRPLRREDRRSDGESRHIRVRDLAATNNLRPGPISLYETQADGVRRLVLLPLGNGDDQLGGVTDLTYIGDDNSNPDLRTGLFTLRNIEEISIVACPGRTTAVIQNALINHCELMRYRFAVLDGPRPPQDTLSDVQTQRQQFDTKYAALYHPWILIPDPYPVNLSRIQEYPIPPSGHMLGIYARTDIERGVHKAPANEVVRGVIGLQRKLNKEQHDILNPYPVNINVIRDFRDNNRGIRVYGGRVITSDSDWKYVNVRRLLIFIEASIDRGLQWVVFEPNAEPLWARVRRSISNFLTLVWRNGGLEGTKVEEAYFVKCDRTTMTQTDIDSGRLICVVGVAPVKPAEFVIVRIGLWTAHAED